MQIQTEFPAWWFGMKPLLQVFFCAASEHKHVLSNVPHSTCNVLSKMFLQIVCSLALGPLLRGCCHLVPSQVFAEPQMCTSGVRCNVTKAVKHFHAFDDYSNIFQVFCGFCTFFLYGEDSQDHLLYTLLVVLNILKNRTNKPSVATYTPEKKKNLLC